MKRVNSYHHWESDYVTMQIDYVFIDMESTLQLQVAPCCSCCKMAVRKPWMYWYTLLSQSLHSGIIINQFLSHTAIPGGPGTITLCRWVEHLTLNLPYKFLWACGHFPCSYGLYRVHRTAHCSAQSTYSPSSGLS